MQYYRIKAKYIYSILCAAHDLATTVREEKVAAAAVRSDKTSTAPPTAAAAAAAGHLAAGVGSSIGNGQQRAAEGAGCCERCATLCSPTTRSFGECEESLTSLDSLLDIQKWPTPRLRKYLLFIDSVALHFRHGFSDMALRTRLLARMAQQLHALADGANAAVVVVNQMTTRVLGSDLAVMEPALGQAWSHTCSNLVQLRWDERVAGHRIAALVKSSHCPCGEAKYEITAAGVRTIGTRSTAAVTSSSGSGSGAADDEAARRMKRQRTT